MRGIGLLGPAAARRAGILCTGLLILIILAAGFPNGDYQRFVVAAVAFNAITVLSISILAGSSGIWSLGHTSFIAIGAYGAANLASLGLPIELILPIVILAAMIVGFILGSSAGRFSILYFGLLTLAVALTTVEILGRLSSLTGGDQGMLVPPIRSWITGRSLGPDTAAVTAVVLATAVYLIADIVVKGAIGRRWRAVKSQRIASTAIGLAPYRQNANAFAFSAAIASVGGVGLAITLGFIEPLTFQLHNGIMLIVATVVGGIGSFVGAIVGAIFIVGVPEMGRDVPDIAAFILGASMIAALLVLPRGIAPTLISLFSRSARRPAGVADSRSSRSTSEAISALSRDLMPASDTELRIKNLSVWFGGLQVLKDIAFDVPPGSVVGLIGPNGAGKTTIINVLSGFVEPTKQSQVTFGSLPLVNLPPYSRLAHGIGRTFQHAELFSDLTIHENLTVAASSRSKVSAKMSTEEVVRRILQSLNLEEVASSYPEELPFGTQKVVDIARALAAGAKLLALDEPFSGLDRNEIEEVRAILLGLRTAGVSVLIIDHAVQEVLSIADHVVVINFGTILTAGSAEHVRTDPEVQKAYFGSMTPVRSGERLHG